MARAPRDVAAHARNHESPGGGPTARPRAARRRLMVGLFDQIIYSATNFLLTILVARHASVSSFGAFALLSATFLIFSAINRGITAEPLMIGFSATGEAEWRRASAKGAVVSFLFGCVSGLLMAAAAATVLPGVFTSMAYVFAIGMPILFVQDFLRFSALARGRPSAALINDSAAGVAQVVISIAVIVLGLGSSSAFIAVWIVGGAVGAVVGTYLLRIVPSFALLWRPPHQRELRVKLGIDNGLKQLGLQGIGYVVAGVAGLAAAGALRAAQTVFNPLSVLNLGVQSAAIPELVRLRAVSLRAVTRMLRKIGVVLILVSTAFPVAVLACPTRIGVKFLGPSWTHAHPLFVWIAIGQIVIVPSILAQAGLRALADGKRTLYARTTAIVFILVSVVPPAIADGAEGAAIGVAIGSAIQSIVWCAFYAISVRAHRKVRARARVEQQWQDLIDSTPALGVQVQPVDWVGLGGQLGA